MENCVWEGQKRSAQKRIRVRLCSSARRARALLFNMQMADKVNFRPAAERNGRPKPRRVRVCERDEVGKRRTADRRQTVDT